MCGSWSDPAELECFRLVEKRDKNPDDGLNLGPDFSGFGVCDFQRFADGCELGLSIAGARNSGFNRFDGGNQGRDDLQDSDDVGHGVLSEFAGDTQSDGGRDPVFEIVSRDSPRRL